MNFEEKRKYFRIDDQMGVSYHRLQDGELEQYQSVGQDLDENELDSVNRQLHDIIVSMRAKQPETARFLTLIDKKIALIANEIDLQSKAVDDVSHRLKQVNISACGVGLVIDEAFVSGEHLSLEITLNPRGVKLRTLAQVISCDKLEQSNEEGSYYLRVEYVELSSQDKDVLIQHLLRRQSKKIRAVLDADEGKLNLADTNPNSHDD